ncbi:MAG: DUF3343 domain-containing protein [Christensenellaceae bacterium]|jgi:hypothetical protein|nr:DUF3343 domain-containing protein [Christensenellaceae bacterium]
MNRLVAFRSRSDALKLYKILRDKGIKCEIVETPRQFGLSCGLSVRFSNLDENNILSILNKNKFNSFNGILKS